MGYEFLDHTADVKFRATGTTLAAAFGAALDALFSTMYGECSIEEKETKHIMVTGTDLQSLLYNLLEEFIFLFEAEQFACRAVTDIVISNLTLTATVHGDNVSDYDVTNSVKAPTYHDMKIEETSEGYVIEAVLDV